LPSKSPSSLDLPVATLASFVYFVQGAVSLSAVALPLLLRQKGWSISQISTFGFVVGLPWTLKILYGALSDGLPLGGKRRKPYVILSSLVSMVSWVGFALFGSHLPLLTIFALSANVGFALTDVVTDALVVERSTEGNAQVYQSLAWGFRSGGAVVGGFLGGWLAQTVPYHWIFLITGLLPLFTLTAGFFIREEPVSQTASVHSLVKPIAQSFRALVGGDLKWFSLLLMIGTFSASFSTPFFFHLKEKLGFNESFLGTISGLAWVGAIVGCFVYAKFLKAIPMKKMLVWSVVLNVVNVLSIFLIQSRVSAVLLSLVGGVTGYLSFLPLIATAAFLSRRVGIEGSLFALLMSVNNLGQLVSVFIGGKLFDIMGLVPLILLSAAVVLAGLLFIQRMKLDGHESLLRSGQNGL